MFYVLIIYDAAEKNWMKLSQSTKKTELFLDASHFYSTKPKTQQHIRPFICYRS